MIYHHGVWCDLSPGATIEALPIVEELGLDTVAIMTSPGKSSLAPRWARAQIARACSVALDLDLRVVATTWPEQSAWSIERHRDHARLWLEAGASAWEVDLEANWLRIDGSAGELAARAAEVVEDLDARFDVTTHTGHREVGERALVPCHTIMAQAYSVCGLPDSDERTPGEYQARAYKLASKRPRTKAVGIGLALWAQRWPGMTAVQSIDTAYRAARDTGCQEIRWWSLKHLLSNAQARRWIASVLE